MIIFQNGNVDVCRSMMSICLHSVTWVVGKMPGLYRKGEFSRPYNSADGVPENVGWFIVAIAIVLFLYIAYKLKKGSNKAAPPKKKKRSA